MAALNVHLYNKEHAVAKYFPSTNAENRAVYGDLTGTFSTNGLTKSTDATTMYWIGALSSSYTPTANSAPKFTISFDVTD